MNDPDADIPITFVTVSRPEPYIHQALESLGQERRVALLVGSLDASYLDRYRDDPELRIVLPSPGEFRDWADRPHGERASWNFWRALVDARHQRRLLLCEDDVVFARGWRPFLTRVIAEIERNQSDYLLSLYWHEAFVEATGSGRVTLDPGAYFGHQAVLYAGRALAEFPDYLRCHGMDNWVRPQDLNLARYASEAGIPIYTTQPSLVQHVGRTSTGQGPFHQTATFVADLTEPAPVACSWHQLPGWFDFEALYTRIVHAACPGARLVEVGCWHGRSVAFLGSEVRRRGVPIAVFAVEHGLGGDTLPEPAWGSIASELVRNVFLCGLNEIVTPIIAPSVGAAAIFADASVDFVFLDANHSYESVVNDLRAWWPKIRPGGMLAGHDYTWTGVRRAVHEFFGHSDLGIPSSASCWGVGKSSDSPESR